ncbi:MAG: D-glycerate dehydrogenase [Paenibacillaceae bacterium]|nr:D-glycerate dehydrogenase [Paenibacillaceae bacterium]
MRPKVFIANPVPQAVEHYIAEHCEYRKWDSEEPIPRDLLLHELANACGLLIAGGRIDRELLGHAPKLKVVSNMSVGYNNFDLEAMKSAGIMGTNTPSVLDDTVADLVFGLILTAARRITELDRYVKEGRWQSGSDKHRFGVDVHHATLGIIGMGRIGEAVAVRARNGFHMNVLYCNRTRKLETERRLGVQYCTKRELLQRADFVVLMVPLTPETNRFFSRDDLAQMKRSAFLINASRGQIVDEEDLIEALATGGIRGAGLDVFGTEPVHPANPLLKLPNVITLPHIGSATERTRADMAMLAARNLVTAVLGEMPPDLVAELRQSGMRGGTERETE